MSSSGSSASSVFPPLAAVFLTHFDDIKGQSVIYYRSAPGLPEGTIEHSTLPSGLHAVEEDVIIFRHGGLPSIGLFRNRSTASQENAAGAEADELAASTLGAGAEASSGEGSTAGASGMKRKGRGRRMATVGVVLALPATFEDTFDLQDRLAGIYDRLEALSNTQEAFTAPSIADRVLDELWEKHGVERLGLGDGSEGEEGRRLRGLVLGKRRVSSRHPITYLPALLTILGPSLVTVYKAALSGQRILIYAQPPLLPIATFAYCIAAFSLPPSSVPDESSHPSRFLGNVGLMELGDLKANKGAWVATTTDKILLSHTSAYDLSIDLSSLNSDSDSPYPIIASTLPGSSTSASPSASGTSRVPQSGKPTPISYAFADIPLYRTLLSLIDSPPGIHAESEFDSAEPANNNIDGRRNTSIKAASRKNDSWWLTFYDLVENVWSLCMGVCEYAIGRGRVGESSNGGARERGRGRGIYLDEAEGDEDARLLGDDEAENQNLRDGGEDEHLNLGGNGDGEEEILGDGEEGDEDEALRQGRLILRQLYHNTYHLHRRLEEVRNGRTKGGLTEKELAVLVGSRWGLGGWMGGRGGLEEGRFWVDVAGRWGMVHDPEAAAEEE